MKNVRPWVLFLALSTERLRPDLTVRGVCVGIEEEELQEAVDGFKTQLTLRALAQIEWHSNIVAACVPPRTGSRKQVRIEQSSIWERISAIRSSKS